MPYFFNNGRRLYYREQGSGPPLVILPGNTASSALHQGDLDHFGRKFHVVVLDFWGTGRSDRASFWPLDWWEIGAGDAAALAASLGETPYVVMGASGGGIAALLMAAKYPASVRAVIADSTVAAFPAGTLVDAVNERLARTPGQIEFWKAAHGEDWEAVVDADSDLLLRVDAAGGDVFHGCLSQIRCPLMITGSLSDEMLPNVSDQAACIAMQVPGSRVYLGREGSHPFMWSRAGEFWRICDWFFESI